MNSNVVNIPCGPIRSMQQFVNARAQKKCSTSSPSKSKLSKMPRIVSIPRNYSKLFSFNFILRVVSVFLFNNNLLLVCANVLRINTHAYYVHCRRRSIYFANFLIAVLFTATTHWSCESKNCIFVSYIVYDLHIELVDIDSILVIRFHFYRKSVWLLFIHLYELLI